MERRAFVRTLSSAGVLLGTGLHLPPWARRVTATLAPPRLDAHAHIISPAVVEMMARRGGGNGLPVKDGAAIVADLDRDGIEKALVLSTAYLHANDLRRQNAVAPDIEAEQAAVRADNDYVAAEAGKAGNRLIPFLGINPKRPYAVEEIDRAAESLGMRGIKLHFWNSDVRLRDPEHVAAVRKVFARAAAGDLPIVAHVYNGFVRDFGAQDIEILLRELVDPFPELRLCVAHLAGAGGSGNNVVGALTALTDGLAAVPSRRDRVTVECSGVFLSEAYGPLQPITAERKRVFARLLRKIGMERVLWGSDNVPNAFRQALAAWPAGGEGWATVAANDGQRLWTRA